MGQNNSSRGRSGISGSASVEVERIDTGQTAPLISDSDDLLLTKIVGEDGSGDFTRLSVDSQGELRVQGLKNQTGITTGRDSGGGALPSLSIPRGRSVRIQALSGNSALIRINSDFELAAGQGVDLAVTDLSQISYTVTNSGDGVCFIVEG